MSSADLLASMKALDLGLSQDSEVNPVDRTKVSKPKPKPKPREDSRLVSQVNNSSVTPLRPQGKLEVDNSIPSAAPEAKSGALRSPESSNNKSGPRHRKKRFNKTQTQRVSSALPAKEHESAAHEASKKTPQTTFVYVVQASKTHEAPETI